MSSEVRPRVVNFPFLMYTGFRSVGLSFWFLPFLREMSWYSLIPVRRWILLRSVPGLSCRPSQRCEQRETLTLFFREVEHLSDS